MGFEVRKATGRSVALKPKKSHGAPVHIDLDALLARKPADREKFLLESADTKFPDAAAKALKSAATPDDLLAALDKRIDRRATPHPVPAGSIILQPTDERRRSGSHYTARSFTHPIVRKTLEPIFARLKGGTGGSPVSSIQKSKINNPQSSISPSSSSIPNLQSPISTPPLPSAILDLKICDIAIGSGAFQVEVCRQLADELVSSWHFHKCLPVIPPDEDEVLFARRLVAQRCLYGVDRNPMAVDLAKLSLWLATMAKDHPFTFLDHAIKCGDSLVGLTNQQIAAFHWDPTQAKDRVFGQEKLEQQIAKVAAARKSILDWTEDTEAAVLKKRDFLAAADSAAASLKTTGDLAIAAFFAGEKPKQRQQNRDEFLHRHLELQKGENIAQNLPWQVNILNHLKGISSSSSSSSSPSSFNLQPSSFPIRPFHWEIEFPEVFARENPGFDVIVGNPPFAGKNTLIGGNADGYLDWLKTLHSQSHGNADLVAHFYRSAFTLSRANGTFGLIATNTIREGDTRFSGLRYICTNGGEIYAANRRTKWPGEAAVIVAVVHCFKGTWLGPRLLDGNKVDTVSAFLFHTGGNENPAVLAQNAGKSYQGPIALGMGFTFDDKDTSGTASSFEEMRRLVAKNPANAECIFSYIGGDEFLDDPTHEHKRYIINFQEWPLGRDDNLPQWSELDSNERKNLLRTGIVPTDYPGKVAQEYPDLLQIVEQKVKPGRLAQNDEGGQRKWWQFLRPRAELNNAVSGLQRILMHSFPSKHLAFAFIPSTTLVAAPHCAFAMDGYSGFATLQSRLHEVWTLFFSSSQEDRLRYTITDCFETFPFPPDWESNSALEVAGREYYEYRAALMVRNDEGLTKTYNRFHDPEERSPDIHQLRTLHAAMDRAVLAAYGWPAIPTACEFLLDYEEDEDAEAADSSIISNPRSTIRRRRKKPYRYRWPDEVRDEVLARLLALNAERAEQERLAGSTGKKSAKKAGKLRTTDRPKRDDEMI